jgi:hypothetical protein
LFCLDGDAWRGLLPFFLAGMEYLGVSQSDTEKDGVSALYFLFFVLNGLKTSEALVQEGHSSFCSLSMGIRVRVRLRFFVADMEFLDVSQSDSKEDGISALILISSSLSSDPKKKKQRCI